MLSRIKEYKRTVIIYVVSFLILIIALVSYTTYIKHNSEVTHTCDGNNNEMDVVIKPRGNASDSWLKDIDGVWYTACIYEATIKNKSNSAIKSWTLTVNPDSKVYLNNAWCGRMNICQKGKNQKLDLRNLNIDDITVNYILIGQDVLIPVEAGEYFEYLPDKETYEYPIIGKLDNNNVEKSVTIGFIMYHKGEGSFDFDDFQVKYVIRRNLSDDPVYKAIWICLALWLAILIFTIVTEIKLKVAKKRLKHDEQIIEQSLSVFTRFIDAKDTYTKGHSLRVAIYSKLIAEKMGLSDEDCKNVYYIALMHDCGKIHISDDILKKPAKLSKEEYEIIKTHTTHGAEMLKDFTSIDGIIEGAMYHHERYDGKGYPTGKAAEDIPLIGRIICVADSFDAMNSSRCYRKKLSKEDILKELEVNKGKQFDPKIVDCFLSLIEEGAIDFDIST